MNAALIVGILVAAGIATTVASWFLTRRDFAKRFLSRPAMDVREALSEFAPDEVQFLATLWPRLEKNLGVPRGRLRLTDRFNVELQANPKLAIYHPAWEVIEDLQELLPREPLNIGTIRDYCECALRLWRDSPSRHDLVKAILG